MGIAAVKLNNSTIIMSTKCAHKKNSLISVMMVLALLHSLSTVTAERELLSNSQKLFIGAVGLAPSVALFLWKYPFPYNPFSASGLLNRAINSPKVRKPLHENLEKSTLLKYFLDANFDKKQQLNNTIRNWRKNKEQQNQDLVEQNEKELAALQPSLLQSATLTATLLAAHWWIISPVVQSHTKGMNPFVGTFCAAAASTAITQTGYGMYNLYKKIR